MYLIAGLGNPGAKYANTRHNAGFCTVDILADRYRIDISEKKHKALCGRGAIEGQKVILLKPQTFMNLSGESLRAAMDYYKLTPEEVLVIYDDVSLDPGQLRIRLKGSAGGHNGIKSIIAHLGTQEFPRIKVGVGARPPRMDLADYVLGHFSGEEQAVMKEAYGEAAAAAAMLLSQGPERAMNHYNMKKSNRSDETARSQGTPPVRRPDLPEPLPPISQ